MQNASMTGSDEGVHQEEGDRDSFRPSFEAEMEQNRPSLVPTNWVVNPGRDHLFTRQQQHDEFRSLCTEKNVK